jgi:elongation factor Tu
VLTISGRGTVVTGAVEQGVIEVGAAVDLLALTVPGSTTVRSVIAGLEIFGKALPRDPARVIRPG